MFYKLIDENTVRKAPNTLEIDGRFVFTTDEKIYNRCGYYKIQELPLPADGRGYTPKYRFEDSLILKDWKLVESVAPTYKERVVSRIREVYSVDDEIAIIRQKDAKPEEYAEYYYFVEKIKEEEKLRDETES